MDRLNREVRPLRILCLLSLVLSLGVSVASSDQFWVAWEGDTFPEDSGWTRYTRAGGDQRTLADGTMTLDGMGNPETVDEALYYTQVLPGLGEWFQADWRLRVDQVSGISDPLLAVGAGDRGIVILEFAESRLSSLLEGTSADFDPGEFHAYSLVSPDLASYALYIDGGLALSGVFIAPAPLTGICWGDGSSSASSVSTWDYVRFGIVPEPSAAFALALAGATMLRKMGPTKEKQR